MRTDGDYNDLFVDLDERLAERGLYLRVVCAGGFVLQKYGIRVTNDIDAFFNSTPLIDSIIKEVGDKYGINPADESWLNNSIQNLNAAPMDICLERLFTGNALTVEMVPLEYVLGMKLESGREQDIIDVSQILAIKGFSDPKRVLDTLEGMGFGGIDNGTLLEAFGLAYGIDWLKDYLIEEETSILSHERKQASRTRKPAANKVDSISERPSPIDEYFDSKSDMAYSVEVKFERENTSKPIDPTLPECQETNETP